MVTCTLHSVERSFERMGFHKDEKLYNYAQRAWEKGKTVNDFSGKAYKYLLSIENRHDNYTEIRIFSGFCFIFKKNGILVTEYKVPKWVLNSNRLKRPRFRGEDDIFASDYEGIFCGYRHEDTACPFFFANL